MVGSDFIEIFNKFKVTTYVGLEDFVDRLNFLFTCSLMLICCTIVTVKTYFMSPLSCYIPTPVSGTGNMDYVTAWCWAEGTYALSVHDMEKLRYETINEIKHLKIHYYQWVPFVLGLQCVLFYLPRVIWQFFSHNCSGTDLEYIITVANDAVHADPEKRKKLLDHLNRNLVNVLYQHREYRNSSFTVVKRQVHKLCTVFMPSKRLGTKLVNFYIVIKIMYAANSIGQLYLMQKFLHMKGDYPIFGYEVMRNLWEGRDWENTHTFPRYGGCTMWLKVAGGTHLQMAQCTLAVNMLNEKIYLFLWSWIFLVAILNCLSIVRWIFRILMVTRQYRFVKKFLHLNGLYSRDNPDSAGMKRAIRHFCKAFLRQDGVFLLKMISINTGDVICSEIVHKLWDTFKRKYAERDFRDDTENEQQRHLAAALSPLMPAAARTPSPDVASRVDRDMETGFHGDNGKRPLLTPPELQLKPQPEAQSTLKVKSRQQERQKQQPQQPKHVQLPNSYG